MTASPQNLVANPCQRARLARLVAEAVERLALDLRGLKVLTEAATGAYVVTPVIAAAAGAEVIAFTRASRHGTVGEVREQTSLLAEEFGIATQVQVVDEIPATAIEHADIVTNSGHLRPLDADFLRRLKPAAVVPLMYESWEYRAADLDLEFCRRHGIAVAGTNEQHPALRVFDYLGILAVHGLLQCHVPVTFSRLLLISGNAFGPHIQRTLAGCEADVHVFDGKSADRYDAVIIAATPEDQPIIGHAGAAKYTPAQIGQFGTLVQVWGDVDRSALPGVACWPPEPPAKGHMGVQLNDVGPEPVVRLQAGGLKVGEVLRRDSTSPRDTAYCQTLSQKSATPPARIQ
jgi:hypothetical protein